MFDSQLIERAIRRIAEERIREAEERGDFDHLPGHGQPLPPLVEGPAETHTIEWIRSWAQRKRLAEAERERARALLHSRM